jgi:branched-chain amino acid transport system substrate-binding protein
MKGISRGIGFILSLFVAVTLFSFAASAQDVIKIGQSTALTGPYATWGLGAKQAATIAVQEINAAGGINGKKLELVSRDSEHNPVKAVANYRELVEKEKCVALLGGSNSSSMLAVAPIINNELKIPVICPATDAVEIIRNEAWQKKLPNYMFRYGMYGEGTAKVMVKFATEIFKADKIALLTWTAGWGVTGRGEVIKTLDAIDKKPVSDESYDTSDTDMAPQMLKIKNAGAQIILNYGQTRENVNALRARAKIGLKVPYISAWGIASHSFYNAAQKTAEGAMTATTLTTDGPQSERMKTFLASYNKAYGSNLEAMPATVAAYDIIYLLAEVMKKNGTDSEAIRKGLEDVPSFNGLAKTFTRPLFTQDRHDAFLWDEDFILCRWTNGQLLKIEVDEKGPFVRLDEKTMKYINIKTGDLL